MTGSELLEKTKKIADKMAMGLINGIAGSNAANSGSVDGVSGDGILRPSKGGTCPPHLVKRRADKESMETKQESTAEKN
ncbi:hypothetical protein KVR01_008407 [Diaporthe batatas]|uniref:uncharacterized protein n=1 Tax=Diaporthe batatas TaxID=748121 RepID=UPI001D04D89C|nr:uncharacterized protein KVR01_008407 [Diaporthe batatas]KAG8161420.1 hypothetical protein KVR01_008407 [Diaporthe batatas]